MDLKTSNFEPAGSKALYPLDETTTEKINSVVDNSEDKGKKKTKQRVPYADTSKKELYNEIQDLKKQNESELYSAETMSYITNGALSIADGLTKILNYHIPFKEVDEDSKNNLNNALALNAKLNMPDTMSDKSMAMLALSTAVINISVDAYGKRKIKPKEHNSLEKLEDDNKEIDTETTFIHSKNNFKKAKML